MSGDYSSWDLQDLGYSLDEQKFASELNKLYFKKRMEGISQ